MTTTHTQGPWTTQGGFVYDSESRIVCDPHALDDKAARRIPGREREANARLIAAAPELYAVLERALRELRVHDMAYDVIRDAAAILAQAEGKGTP